MRRATAIPVFAAAVTAADQALAHGGEAYVPPDLAWRIAVAIPLLLAGFAYFRGLRRAWRRAGTGRGVSRGEALSFGAGFAALALMLALPLHAWGRLRFAPHMAEHELLTIVAAPLLAAGRPGVPYLLALSLSGRRWVGRWIINGGARRLWRALVHPGVAWALHGAALWLWHAPSLFEAALRSEAIHYLQHATLLTSALLFWASILPRRADTRTRVVGVFSLFTTSMHSTLLGALLTLSPTVWYASYAIAAGPPGPSALEDQQLAGLIMWVPAGLVYVAAALALCAAILRDDGNPSQLGRMEEQAVADHGASR
jgi:cytochrome c oxidase assembly factor CtaG